MERELFSRSAEKREGGEGREKWNILKPRYPLWAGPWAGFAPLACFEARLPPRGPRSRSGPRPQETAASTSSLSSSTFFPDLSWG